MRVAVLALATSLALISNAKADDLRVIAVAANQTGGDMLLTDSHCDKKPGLAVLSTDSYGDVQAAGCATRTSQNRFSIAWDTGETTTVPYATFALTSAGDQYAQIGLKMNTPEKRIAHK